MEIIAPQDLMFLLGETRERPTHIGSLMLFDRPPDAGPDFVADLRRRALAHPEVAPVFRRRVVQPVTRAGLWSWEHEDDVDLEHHVRISALPRPGRIRELLELVSRLHSTLLDRNRPLWECHVIDGVEGDRFAVYTKLHHCLMDGVTSMKHLRRALSTDPDARSMAPYWAVDRPGSSGRATSSSDGSGGVVAGARALAGSVAGAASDALGVLPALATTAWHGLRSTDTALPLQAPPSMLNVPITGARRFAADSWPIERIDAVRSRLGGTVNDVVLALVAGALRRYLAEQDALPEQPLVAALPVATGQDGGGNALAAIVVSLATDDADPGSRYERILTSGRSAKDNLRGRGTLTTAALSLAVAAPLVLGAVPGAAALPQGFNLIVSNVPGPPEPLYWDGARLTDLYPVSVPYDGQALNVTVVSYDEALAISLTGCRAAVPHLQHLLDHLEAALVELEEAAAA